MNQQKVYIETTIFNRYLEDHREYFAETRQLFEKIKTNEIEAYTSTYVIEEIDKAPEPKRENMLAIIKQFNITVLGIDQQASDLADIYLEMGVIPPKFRLDAVHIAMAAVHNMDCIISLNFNHINKLKTKTATEIINKMKGYNNPFICAPMEVIEHA
jgi:predicted nucleic acid-binding protein